MEMAKPETDPFNTRKGSTKGNLHNRHKNSADPGTVQDYESRRMLQRAQNGLKRNKNWVYCSFLLELVVVLSIFATWISLMKVKPATDEEILKDRIKIEKEHIQRNMTTLTEKQSELESLTNALDYLKEQIQTNYSEYERKMKKIDRETEEEQNKIENLVKKIERFSNAFQNKCGLTQKMTKDFNVSITTPEMVSHAQMHCEDKECHCYGKICLVSENGTGSCSAGNVFVNGRAFCGVNDAFNLEFGNLICKELGFNKAVEVTTSRNVGKFGRVTNDLVRGFAVRGWNFLDSHPNYQQHCSNEKSFSDCFEKYNDAGRESGIEGFFAIHGNYYFNGKISKYDPSKNCGDSTAPSYTTSYSENAQGVVCK